MATTMLNAGVSVSVVAGRLGHARPTTILNVYSHFVDSGDQAAADTIGQILDKPAATNPAHRMDKGWTDDGVKTQKPSPRTRPYLQLRDSGWSSRGADDEIRTRDPHLGRKT